MNLTPDEIECALRTLAELYELGAVEAQSEHLSTRQIRIAERLSALYPAH